MTAAAPGSLRAVTTEPGWLRIPPDLSTAERDAWVDELALELRDAWDGAWDERAEVLVPLMLRNAIDERPDAHMVFEAWPVFLPVRARVQISVVDPATLPDWSAAGFSVIAYDDAPLGPGITCVRTTEAIDPDPVALIDWCSVFSDGELAVVVQVETIPLDFFVRVMPGLHGLVGTLQMTQADGTAFEAKPSEHVLVDDEAVWDGLRLHEAGLTGTERDRGSALGDGTEHGDGEQGS